MNKLIKLLFKPFFGKKEFQKFFVKLHLFALKGMNFSYALVENSGEKAVLKDLKKKWQKNEQIIIFDVGANVGDYLSAIMSIFPNENVKVFGFEPVDKTFYQLFKNFGEKSNIFLNKLALGEMAGQAEIFSSGDSSLYSFYERKINNLKAPGEKEKISVQTLDSFVQEKNISHIDLLKLDVEGHELAVLKGSKCMIENSRIDCIQFEFGGANLDSRTFLRDFFDLLSPKYNIYRILQNGLQSIPILKETDEIFFTANYLAIRKDLN